MTSHINIATDTPRSPAASEHRGAGIWTLRLLGLRSADLDLVVTCLLVAGLAVSRFAFLASGPWEWDETLFARGVLKFDLAAHFPHPPGFPLWILLGRLILPFVSEPLKGLQLLSATASLLTLWPLAALGRRVAPPGVAAAAALAVLLAPGVWLHAGRGFSSTPSAFFALWAAALAVWGLEGRRATWFSLLVTAAFLVRPILLVPLGLLWLAGALAVRPRKRLLPGVALGVAAGAAALVWMIVMQGGWTRFITPFAVHGSTHARNLVVNQGPFPDWGIVKGLGGVPLAVGFGVLALLGLVVWARRVGRMTAVAWLLVLGTGIWQIVAIQNRTFPRYAVPFQLGLAPLVAAAAATAAPPAIAATALLGLGAFLATDAYPVVEEQHTVAMPGWEAVRFAVAQAESRKLELVVEPGLHPFLSYLEEVERRRGHQWSFPYHLGFSSPDAASHPEGAYILVTDYPFQHFGPLVGPTRTFNEVSAELVPFTQRRFLRCWVAENPLLPLQGWYLAEDSRQQSRFRWGGPGASILVPPVPVGTELALEVAPARGPSSLPVVLDGRLLQELGGRAPRTPVRIPHDRLSSTRTTVVTFPRAESYTPGGKDARRLVAQLFGCRVAQGPPLPFAVRLADGTGLKAVAGRLEGTWQPEQFPFGRGVWTQPDARLWLPIGEGRLRLLLAAPRPTPARLEVLTRGVRLAGPVEPGPAPSWIEIPLPAPDAATGGLELVLRTVPYSPARAGHGRDSRELGVVLIETVYRPAHPIPSSFPDPVESR
ncbi:MAG: hypothetical protein MUF10_13035 [Thermoanaerobaculaceae bacterium]|jgi:hypothetical protein|nr:hypothetical protein [Thermoanaerobaculaceae bacterium]